MQSLLLTVDRISGFFGKVFSWSIVLLTFAVSYEVFSRYVLKAPTTWAYDWSLILYGTLFMMAGAYTLSRNGHVRGDFLYRKWSPRTQGWMDLALYFLCFFPGILALIYSGWGFFKLSWMMNEHSSFSPAGPPIWPFKALIPIAGVLMLLQGFAEVVRCIQAIQNNEWPQRLHDIEELEKLLLENPEEADKILHTDRETV